MSLREMLTRFTRGQAIPPQRQGGYEDEEDFSDYDHLDQFEKMEMRLANKAHIDEIQKELAKPPRTESAANEAAQKGPGDNSPGPGDKPGDKAGDKPAATA